MLCSMHLLSILEFHGVSIGHPGKVPSTSRGAAPIMFMMLDEQLFQFLFGNFAAGQCCRTAAEHIQPSLGRCEPPELHSACPCHYICPRLAQQQDKRLLHLLYSRWCQTELE